jgi:ribosomal protein L39E
MFKAIEGLGDMPARCPMLPESQELGQEVRLLLHGRKNRSYKIYFSIRHETSAVCVFHVRHWARRDLIAEELAGLLRGAGG